MRISMDRVAKIVESSTAAMSRLGFMCLVLIACGHESTAVQPDAPDDDTPDSAITRANCSKSTV